MVLGHRLVDEHVSVLQIRERSCLHLHVLDAVQDGGIRRDQLLGAAVHPEHTLAVLLDRGEGALAPQAVRDVQAEPGSLDRGRSHREVRPQDLLQGAVRGGLDRSREDADERDQAQADHEGRRGRGRPSRIAHGVLAAELARDAGFGERRAEGSRERTGHQRAQHGHAQKDQGRPQPDRGRAVPAEQSGEQEGDADGGYGEPDDGSAPGESIFDRL